MVSSRHLLLLLSTAAALVVVPATAAELATVQGPTEAAPAPWTWTWSEASDDESCWGDPKECPVVYDVGVGIGGVDDDDAWRRGRRLQYSDGTTGGEENLLPTPYTYISYSALARDTVPCSVPGASYYNCEPGAEANPYTRGCSAIAQCRD